MSGALESSITLDDVFTVVGAKRVPLAPELAGYLALEIAEGATQAAGDVDPRSVYIGEEGSVALVVRPRRDAQPGDAESSIRALLQRLLEASGSHTPALASTARRSPNAGLGALVEELEAALIPVNRAAGRRALARLAREVKRVTLGVGRNASLAPGEPPAPRRGSSPAHTAVRDGRDGRDAPLRPAQDEPREPRAARSGFAEEPPTTAKRDVLPDPNAGRRRAEPPAAGTPTQAQDSPSDAPVTRSTSPDASELPTLAVSKEQREASLRGRTSVDADAKRGAPVDEVDHLLASFGVSSRGEHVQRNELKALVGLEPTPPPPGSEHAYDARESRPVDNESDVESLLAISDAAPPVAPRGRAGPAAGPGGPGAAGGALASPPTAISPALANEPYERSARIPAVAPTVASAVSVPSSGPRLPRATDPDAVQQEGGRSIPTSPSARKIASMASVPNIKSSGDRTLTVFALAILLAGGAAVWLLRPAIFGPPEPPAAPTPAASSAPIAALPAAPRCHASVIVKDAPPNAEILLRAGQAPVDVEKMPVGARLEFVATAEGFAPKRAVVPSGATWDTGADGKPRYEVAVQLDRSRARAGSVDTWPAGEPGSEVGGKGAPGTVHLVTTPRGAEVWFLAGLGPDAEIDQLKCGGEVEVLVAGPTTLRKRIRIAESDFVAVDGGADRQATVSAK